LLTLQSAHKNHVSKDDGRAHEIDPEPSLPLQVDRDKRVEQDGDADEKDAPAFAVGLPLYYGLEILRGTHGDTMPPPARNLVGALVLIGGLIVGLAVQFGWYWMFDKLRQAISG
jgi:hypothetical protein